MQQVAAAASRDDVKVIAAGAVAVTGVVFATRWWLSNRRLPPGPNGLPFIGPLQMIDQTKLHRTIHEASKKHDSGIISFRMGQLLMIAVTKYDYIKEMLDNPVFAGRPRIPLVTRITQNCGIIFTEGEVWSQQRRVSLRALRDYGFGREKSVEMVDNAIDSLLTWMDSVSQNNEQIHLLSNMLELSNSVIAQLTFGRHFSTAEPDYAEFCESVKPFMEGSLFNPLVLYPILDNIVRLLPAPPRLTRLVLYLQNFILDQIKLRKQAMAEDEDCEAQCVCDSYIQEQRRAEKNGDFETFKDHQLVRVCLELFLAGTDTTARSTEWLLLYMAFYPEVQRKVQQEIETVCGQSRRPRLSDRTNLNYTNAVIDEVYRMVTLIPVGVFHRAVHDTEFHGYRIPSDAIILPCVYSVHQDDSLWSEPKQFNPDRFLNEEGKYKSSPHLIPFLIGKRACLGESLARIEIFMTFTSVMQLYTVAPSADSASRREEILRGSLGAVMLPGNYKMTVAKR